MPGSQEFFDAPTITEAEYFVPPEVAGEEAGGVDTSPTHINYLRHIDTLVVRHSREPLETAMSFEPHSHYQIVNSNGEPTFHMFEESECFERQACGAKRTVVMHITDNMNNEIVRLLRPYSCTNSGMYMNVECPPGHQLGALHVQGACFKASISVIDREAGPFATISGNTCTCTREIEFPITSDKHGEQLIGVTTKKPGNILQELFTDRDTFQVSFSMWLSPRAKVLLLATAVLIDLLFYEDHQRH